MALASSYLVQAAGSSAPHEMGLSECPPLCSRFLQRLLQKVLFGSSSESLNVSKCWQFYLRNRTWDFALSFLTHYFKQEMTGRRSRSQRSARCVFRDRLAEACRVRNMTGSALCRSIGLGGRRQVDFHIQGAKALDPLPGRARSPIAQCKRGLAGWPYLPYKELQALAAQ